LLAVGRITVSAWVYLADPSWYHFLRDNPRSLVNYWRSDTRWFGGRRGELFFCLIRDPIRAHFVGAVARVDRYRLITVQQAWDEYGEANGAASADELLKMLRRVFGDFSITLDRTIGCIILQDFRVVMDAPPLPGHLHSAGQNPGKKISDDQGGVLFAGLTLLGVEPDTSPVPEYAPPGRAETITARVIRDAAITKELKTLYDGRCQICGYGIPLENGEMYVEAHHVKPLGRDRGPDHPSNVLILCPNHHAEFEYEAIMVDPVTLTVQHSDPANRWHSSRLTVNPRHKLDPQFLRYHAEHRFYGARRS
jgi:hypothetical protein